MGADNKANLCGNRQLIAIYAAIVRSNTVSDAKGGLIGICYCVLFLFRAYYSELRLFT
jgi:hypothetical protein